MSTIRHEKTAADIIDELRKEIIKLKALARKSQTSIILNYIRTPQYPTGEDKDVIHLTDSVTTGAKFNVPKDTITLGAVETLTPNIYSRFELEAVDGLHSQETAIKVEFWELRVA